MFKHAITCTKGFLLSNTSFTKVSYHSWAMVGKVQGNESGGIFIIFLGELTQILDSKMVKIKIRWKQLSRFWLLLVKIRKFKNLVQEITNCAKSLTIYKYYKLETFNHSIINQSNSQLKDIFAISIVILIPPMLIIQYLILILPT